MASGILRPDSLPREIIHTLIRSQDSAVGLDDQGVEVRDPVESSIFSSSHRPDRL
jgi:hypothetical protein